MITTILIASGITVAVVALFTWALKTNREDCLVEVVYIIAVFVTSLGIVYAIRDNPNLIHKGTLETTKEFDGPITVLYLTDGTIYAINGLPPMPIRQGAKVEIYKSVDTGYKVEVYQK